MLAVLWGALAPTLAQALVRAGPAPAEAWVAVCSVSGMVWVELASGDRQDSSPAHGANGAQHCAWCGLHGSGADLVPMAASAALVAQFQSRPSAFYRAPATAAVWRSAQSRAPPVPA